ncbi:MAG TPA: hypothetical protein PLU80_14865, partial [Acidobacteriota bacterium]|nr:hypothetical protein [Acidobacteriota bacterium]
GFVTLCEIYYLQLILALMALDPEPGYNAISKGNSFSKDLSNQKLFPGSRFPKANGIVGNPSFLY